MEKTTLNIMQKINLASDQIIEVNGAILNPEILAEIRQLQTGLDSMEIRESLGVNHGLKSDVEDYQKLLNYLVSQADYTILPLDAFRYTEFVLGRMEYLQLFRVPGTEKIKLY